MTHPPTGLSADSHHERSQHKNGDLALRILAGRIWVFRADQELPEAERLYDTAGSVRPDRIVRVHDRNELGS